MNVNKFVRVISLLSRTPLSRMILILFGNFPGQFHQIPTVSSTVVSIGTARANKRNEDEPIRR